MYKITHGFARRGNRRAEYAIWSCMIQRCENPKDGKYYNYGARGIGVCQSWRLFKNFIADMGERPSKKHSLERKDNSLGYCKENCKWATIEEQNSNKRSTRVITAFGETKPLFKWVADPRCKVGANALWARLNAGWASQDCISRPVHSRNPVN